MKTNQVVFIGAGPVGLATAIAMKKANKSLDITMVERYDEYIRNHTLKLELSSVKDPELQKTLSALADKKEAKTKKVGNTLLIPVQTLEKTLKEEARNLDIKTEIATLVADDLDKKNQSSTPEKLSKSEAKPKILLTKQELLKKYKDCKLFVGTDGTHSEFRKQFFGPDEEYKIEKPKQYTVQFKYRVAGPAKKLDFKTDFKTNKLINHMCFEHIGKHVPGTNEGDPGYTDISLQFFVDKKTFDALEQATARTPAALSSDTLPGKFLMSVNVWLNARKTIYKEKVVPVPADKEKNSQATPSLTKTLLSNYYSPEYAKVDKEGRVFVRAGDAAFGVPYFRALNNGFITSDALGKDFADHDPAESHEEAKKFVDEYNSSVNWLYIKESIKANIKNFFITAWQLLIAVSSLVIWQVNYWNDDEQTELRNAHEIFKEEGQEQNLKKASEGHKHIGKLQFHNAKTIIELSSPSVTESEHTPPRPTSEITSSKATKLADATQVGSVDLDSYLGEWF